MKIILILLLLTNVCMADDVVEVAINDELNIYAMEITPKWYISNNLIEKLGLEPNEDGGMIMLGEDGKWYDFGEIIEAHIKWVEKREHRGYPHECPRCTINVDVGEKE